jgi:hypothetical protein
MSFFMGSLSRIGSEHIIEPNGSDHQSSRHATLGGAVFP